MDLFLDSFKCLKFTSKWLFLACSLVLTIHSPYVISADTFENPRYVDEFEECLNLRNSIPDDYPITFDVTKVNNHMEIVVEQDEKYDYYELNASGGCFTAVRKEMKPIRTPEEQMQCDSKNGYYEQFKCGYEVIKNDSHAIVLIHSSAGVYEYIIDRITKKTEIYLYQKFKECKMISISLPIFGKYISINSGNIFSEILPQKEDKCLNRKHISDFHIPLEVTKKPIDADGYRHYLEILVKYEGKYDLYVTEESGFVRHVQLKIQDKPRLNLSDYLDEIKCSHLEDFLPIHAKDFRCPLKVIENENYVNISVNAFHNEHRYVIDKISNDIKYFTIEDTRYLTDADRNYNADMDKCIDEINNKTYPFPVEVRRNKDFLEIWVEFNKTFDIYKTIESGKEMCEIIRRSSQKPSQHFWKSLAQVHPYCLSCDGPAFSYACPKVRTTDNVDAEILEIEYTKGFEIIISGYERNKSTGEISSGERGWAGLVGVVGVSSSIIKSLVG